ncbi:hypothetical protein EHS19_02850 [Bifidobacterium jacchi]|uniref:Uncharacterized protein n=1 Tax=Bifidobacterium jacchi TaxID=2490545 RepID=A0A5N5RMU2_9BIFI|nr:hypothetical protein EHS19_02850 [Bifidobacterium jacchi]
MGKHNSSPKCRISDHRGSISRQISSRTTASQSNSANKTSTETSRQISSEPATMPIGNGTGQQA